MSRTLTIEEAAARPLTELLREVADGQEALRVVLDEGQEIEIRAVPPLRPLITLPTRVPEGWKDAVYGPEQDLPGRRGLDRGAASE
jgi:hypothetical protein